jgi:hypothetical protein
MTSEVPQFLKKMGISVEKTVVKTDLRYSSVVFKLPEYAEKKFCYYQQFPPSMTKGGAVVPIEDGNFLVSCITLNGAPIPKTIDQFMVKLILRKFLNYKGISDRYACNERNRCSRKSC